VSLYTRLQADVSLKEIVFIFIVRWQKALRATGAGKPTNSFTAKKIIYLN